MKKNGSSHIRKWLWFYMLAVALTTAASYFFIYQQIVSLLAQHTGSTIATSLPEAQAISAANLKSHILLLMTGSLLTLLVGSFVWLRVVMYQIHRPLLIIRRALVRLAQGRLNETVSLDRVDEFGQMGAKINELAANLQELLLCIWKQTGQCLGALETLQGVDERKKSALPAQTVEQLQQVTASIESLREMAKAYVFYDVRLDGDQTLAIDEPGQKKSASSSSI